MLRMIENKNVYRGDDGNSAEIPEMRDECGLWAAWDPDHGGLLEAAHKGALGVQHRGEDAAGIAVISPSTEGISLLRGVGMVDASATKKFTAYI